MPSTGIVTVNAGCEVALGALLGASSPATETAVDAGETGGTVAMSSTASAGGAVAGGTGGEASMGGMDSIAEGAAAAAVPEPSTFALLGVGVLGLLAHVGRRRTSG